MNKRMSLKWLQLAIFCGFTGSVLAGGFQIYPEGSASSLSLGGSMVGRTDDASLAWYNPAALAGGTNTEVMAGVSVLQVRTTFTSPNGTTKANDDWQAVPHLYAVMPVSDRVAASLSVNVPYGLAMDWPDDWEGQYLSTYAELQALYITPALSFKLDEWDGASVAMGFNVVPSTAQMETAQFTMEGDGVGYGMNISAHLPINDVFAFGLRYQSAVDVEYEGDMNLLGMTLPVTTDITMPAAATVGFSGDVNEKWNLSFDAVWTEWSRYNELAVNGAPIPVSPKHWENVWSYRVGTEYMLNESWVLRAGYVLDETPIPDPYRSPEVPGANFQSLSAGVGWINGRYGVNLAYCHTFVKDAPGTLTPPGITGMYASELDLFSLSFLARF